MVNKIREDRVSTDGLVKVPITERKEVAPLLFIHPGKLI